MGESSPRGRAAHSIEDQTVLAEVRLPFEPLLAAVQLYGLG